jgi:hypothetical protein
MFITYRGGAAPDTFGTEKNQMWKDPDWRGCPSFAGFAKLGTTDLAPDSFVTLARISPGKELSFWETTTSHVPFRLAATIVIP